MGPTKPQPISSARVHFFLVLTTFFWGGSFLFTKLGLKEVAPVLFVFCRFALATVVMLGVCAGRLKGLDRNIIRRGTIVGITLGVTNLSFVFGVSGTSISRAGILNNLFVLFIPLIGKLIWRDRIGRINMVGIAMAVAGIWLLATGGGSGFNRGDAISTLCAFFIAVQILAVSKVLRDEDVYLVSLVQFAVVAVMAGLALLASPPPILRMSLPAAGTIVYCAIFPTVLCFTLQNTFQRYTTPTRAGLIYTLDPIWSLLAGFLVLGERLGDREWLGCGLIFAAALFPLAVRFIVERRLRERYTGNAAGSGQES